MRFKIFFIVLVSLLTLAMVTAQTETSQGKEGIFVVIKDIQGEKLEGYLRLDPDELTISTKDNREKTVPLKLIESIKVEKIPSGVPGAEQMGEQLYYSVRMQNNQEIFSLRKKYTFHLNTSVGVVTKTIDPEMVREFFQKDPSLPTRSKSEQPFIQDKSVIFSLEVKF